MYKDASERLSALVKIPTVSAVIEQSGPEPFKRLVVTLRQMYPLLHQHLDCERFGLGLLFHWVGTDASLANEPLVLMAHFDVVPVDESDPWTYPPFDGMIADGKVWGRGTLDDKGALLVICEAVESLLATGFTPKRDIYLSFGSNEEVFGADAVDIASTLKQRGIRPHLVLDEGGAVVDAPLKWVKVRSAMVGVGEKGILTLRLDAEAEPGHASAPEADNAVIRVGRAVSRLTTATFPAHLPKAICTMLGMFAPYTSGPVRVLLAVLAKTCWLTGRVFVTMGGEPAALAHTTVAPTMISGGTASNVLPSRASATLNIRIALGETIASATARVTKRIGDDKIKVTVVEGSEPSPESSTSNTQFAAISAAVEASYPGVVTAPYVMMAATDSRHFHTYCDAVYRFAPLAMDAVQRAAIHGIDERVDIDSLARGQAFHEHLIRSVT